MDDAVIKEALYRILQNQGAMMLKLNDIPDIAGKLFHEGHKACLVDCCTKTGDVMKKLLVHDNLITDEVK